MVHRLGLVLLFVVLGRTTYALLPAGRRTVSVRRDKAVNNPVYAPYCRIRLLSIARGVVPGHGCRRDGRLHGVLHSSSGCCQTEPRMGVKEQLTGMPSRPQPSPAQLSDSLLVVSATDAVRILIAHRPRQLAARSVIGQFRPGTRSGRPPAGAARPYHRAKIKIQFQVAAALLVAASLPITGRHLAKRPTVAPTLRRLARAASVATHSHCARGPLPMQTRSARPLRLV